MRAEYKRPWCVIDDDGSSVGPGSLYPIGLTLDTLAKVLIRLYLFRCVITLDTGITPPNNIQTADSTDATELLSEQSPVCQPVGAHALIDTLPAAGGIGVQVRLQFDLWADAGDFPVYQFEGLYYPAISIGLEGESLVRGTFRSGWLGSPPATVITCTFFSQIIELRNVGGFPDYVSGSVVIEAAIPASNPFAEYTGARGPVWDKQTGAQLIFPIPLT